MTDTGRQILAMLKTKDLHPLHYPQLYEVYMYKILIMQAIQIISHLTKTTKSNTHKRKK